MTVTDIVLGTIAALVIAACALAAFLSAGGCVVVLRRVAVYSQAIGFALLAIVYAAIDIPVDRSLIPAAFGYIALLSLVAALADRLIALQKARIDQLEQCAATPKPPEVVSRPQPRGSGE